MDINNNNQYTKFITLKSLKQVFIKHFYFIIVFTLLVLGIGTIGFTKITYKSSAQLINGQVLTNSSVNTFKIAFKSNLIINRIEENLSNNGIYHKNGSKITADEITEGLEITSSNNSTYIYINFTGTDKSILKDTLNASLTEIINYFTKEDNKAQFYGLKIFNEPSEPVDISNNKQKILIFGFLGLTLSYCISFIVDYKYDLVYEINDVIDLNTNVLELNYTERKQEKNE